MINQLVILKNVDYFAIVWVMIIWYEPSDWACGTWAGYYRVLSSNVNASRLTSPDYAERQLKTIEFAWSRLKLSELPWSSLKFPEVARNCLKFPEVFWSLQKSPEVSWSRLKSPASLSLSEPCISPPTLKIQVKRQLIKRIIFKQFHQIWTNDKNNNMLSTDGSW